MTETTISVCAIVKNEEHNIKNFIENIKDKVDEIIITDTGSTDNTLEIIKSYGIKAYYYKWDNNFSNARNYCISNATKDWILSLDADESLIINDSYKDKLINTDHVYMINIKHFINNNSDIHSTWSTKLFPNFQDFIYHGAIHEFVDRKKEYTKSALKELEINHIGFNKISKDKINRNRLIIEESIKTYNKKDNYYKHLLYLAGREYLFSNDYLNAKYYFEEFINSEPDFNQLNLIDGITYLIKILYIEKDFEKLEYYSKKYMDILINNPDFCILYGKYLSNILHNYKQAIFYFQKCLYFKNNIFIQFNLSSITYEPNYLIGINYLNLNMPELAVKYFKESLKYKSNYDCIYYTVLGYSYFDKTEAKKIIDSYTDILKNNEILNLYQIIS